METKIKALVFPNPRYYKTKDGRDMIVAQFLLLDDGSLIEQHFTTELWASLDVDEAYYFRGQNNSAYCFITLVSQGFRNVVSSIIFVGLIELRLTPQK